MVTDTAQEYIAFVQEAAFQQSSLSRQALRTVFDTEVYTRAWVRSRGRVGPGFRTDLPSLRGGVGFDNHVLYDELALLAKNVEVSVRSRGVQGLPPTHQATRLATVPNEDVNLRTVRMPGTQQHIIFVGWQYLALCSRFCFALASVIVDLKAGRSLDPADPDGALHSEAAQSFITLVVADATTGRPSAGIPCLVPPEACELASMLLEGVETFAIAHEYAHIVEGHIAEIPVSLANSGLDADPSFALEKHADVVGLILQIATLARLRGLHPGLAYCAADLYFTIQDTIEKAREIAGQLTHKPIASHPAAASRRELLRGAATGTPILSGGAGALALETALGWQEVAEQLLLMAAGLMRMTLLSGASFIDQAQWDTRGRQAE